MNKSILSIALILSVVASGAHAERASLNLNAQGSLSRQADQRLTDTRPVRELRETQREAQREIRREVTRTHVNGEVSQRNELVTRDAETGVIMRNVNGITANGRSYSGESATEVLVNKEAATLNRQMTATRTNSEGESKSISGESQLARTEDGISGESSMTDARGNTRTRSVDASVNKDAGSMTKTVNASGPNGQASTTTTVTRTQSTTAE